MRFSPKQLSILLAAALAVVVIAALIAMRKDSDNRRAEQARREAKRAEAEQEVTEGVNRFTDKLKVPSGPTLWGDPAPTKNATPAPAPAQHR